MYPFGSEFKLGAKPSRAPAPRPRRSGRDVDEPAGDAQPHRQGFGSIEMRGRLRSPRARPGRHARRRPHAPADSRNKSGHRRPCIWRQTPRSGRPCRRRRGDRCRQSRADPRGRSAPSGAVEPTRSQKITVSWRRSASATAKLAGAAGDPAVAARPSPLGRSAIAFNSSRRWPIAPTPSSLRSSAVSSGRMRWSISLSRNACS